MVIELSLEQDHCNNGLRSFTHLSYSLMKTSQINYSHSGFQSKSKLEVPGTKKDIDSFLGHKRGYDSSILQDERC